jgi:hypothetical protein
VPETGTAMRRYDDEVDFSTAATSTLIRSGVPTIAWYKSSTVPPYDVGTKGGM